MDIKNLPLHYLVQREIFFNDRALFYVNEFLGLSFSASVNLGNVMFNTPFSTWAPIFSLSTSSGRIMVCWNLVYENSRRK